MEGIGNLNLGQLTAADNRVATCIKYEISNEQRANYIRYMISHNFDYAYFVDEFDGNIDKMEKFSIEHLNEDEQKIIQKAKKNILSFRNTSPFIKNQKGESYTKEQFIEYKDCSIEEIMEKFSLTRNSVISKLRYINAYKQAKPKLNPKKYKTAYGEFSSLELMQWLKDNNIYGLEAAEKLQIDVKIIYSAKDRVKKMKGREVHDML